jgi:hypothetical protein
VAAILYITIAAEGGADSLSKMEIYATVVVALVKKQS